MREKSPNNVTRAPLKKGEIMWPHFWCSQKIIMLQTCTTAPKVKNGCQSSFNRLPTEKCLSSILINERVCKRLAWSVVQLKKSSKWLILSSWTFCCHQTFKQIWSNLKQNGHRLAIFTNISMMRLVIGRVRWAKISIHPLSSPLNLSNHFVENAKNITNTAHQTKPIPTNADPSVE